MNDAELDLGHTYLNRGIDRDFICTRGKGTVKIVIGVQIIFSLHVLIQILDATCCNPP